MTPWLLLGLACLLVAANAVFVAAETALLTLERAAVDAAARRGERGARMILAALARLSTQLSASQVGITVSSLAIGLLTQPSLATLLAAPLSTLGLGDAATGGIALTLALLIASAVQLVLGELVPKNLALARPFPTARRVLPLQLAFAVLARPLIRVLNATANLLLRLVGVEPTEELRSARTPDELSRLVRSSAEGGSLADGEALMLLRSLSFGEKRASDVMTPRVQVRFVRADAPLSAVISAARETGHSRFPVIASGPDEISGFVHVKHAVAIHPAERGGTRVRDVAVEPVLVPATLELDPLLDRLREHGLQMAVVVDEYGGTAGIVTFEDLVEELVGEVADERDDAPAPARSRRDGSWLLSGLLRIDEAVALTARPIPEGEYETLGGLVQTRLGRIPRVGDAISLPEGCELRVQRMDRRRVDRLVLVPAELVGREPVDADEDAAAEGSGEGV